MPSDHVELRQEDTRVPAHTMNQDTRPLGAKTMALTQARVSEEEGT